LHKEMDEDGSSIFINHVCSC